MNREELIDVLVEKPQHKISSNYQGGYDCRCGARWDWQKSEKAAAERHAAGYLADRLLSLFEEAYAPTEKEENGGHEAVRPVEVSVRHGEDGPAADQAGFCRVGDEHLHRRLGVRGDCRSGGTLAGIPASRGAAHGLIEQAYAPPTDDEREVALIEKIKLAGHVMSEGMIYPNSDYPVKAIPYTRFLEILSGFRRTVQGELTAGQAGPCARGDHETCQVVAGMGIGSCGCACHGPQGKPTLRDHVRALTGLTDAGPSELGGFHGEPTDSQVQTFWDEYKKPEHRGHRDATRAALRAAFNETGENHG